MKLFCTAEKATSNLENWKKYVDGHAQILRDFGIEILTSHGEEWILNPDVYLISIFNEEKKMVGGIKIHKANEIFPLPVENAIGYLEERIHGIINRSIADGAAEICGLWISQEYGRRGLAHFLTRVAIAVCEPLGIHTIFGISSPFTLNMFTSLGYEVMTNLGENGNFQYPTNQFISAAVMITDTFNLPLAHHKHREKIFDLRLNPIQTAMEDHIGVQTTINYNLSKLMPLKSE
jgi:hypothetical protein